MSKNHKRKTLALGILLLLIAGLFIPCSQSSQKQTQKNPFMINHLADKTTKNGKITCYAVGNIGKGKQDVVLSTDEAAVIFNRLNELKSEMTHNPFSKKTRSLKIAFIDLLAEKGVLPDKSSKEAYLSVLTPPGVQRLQDIGIDTPVPQAFVNRGSCVICSVGGEGSGILFPLFLLPRPRIGLFWLGNGGSAAANLLTGHGYVADGIQTGIALGFIGIGISYAVPGFTLYGFIGYALFASTTAEYVEHYPLNSAPVVSAVNPTDGEKDIPLSLSELQFQIQDADGDLMSYSVTTNPDIGSASGNLKPFGVYSVPVSGLQGLTNYSWFLQVTDGKDTTEKTFGFTTEAIAPVISNPLPADNAQYVPIETLSLSFNLKDYQGDLMNWTVETHPNIGSGAGNGVGDGRYTVAISGLDYFTSYTWFVNATDGEHWTKKTFLFKTIAENTLVLEPTDDTGIMENHPDDIAGNSDSMTLRSGSGWEWDVLIKFNISSIPLNVTIQYASLQCYYYRNYDGNPSGHQVNLFRITSDWDEETVTWNTHPSYVTEPSSFAWVPSTIDKWIVWNVTGDILVFYNSGTPNYGWRTVDVSGGYQCTYLRSKEYSEYHPLLIIGYQ
jgi:hypothetical protein